jgi:YHS domain-containing protein
MAASGGAPVEAVNKGRGGVALKGHDSVAYFTESKPVKGSASLAQEWNGAVWHFSTEENQRLFAANPAQYAPQYGGYCSWAVSKGYTADIDPAAWKIVDGKLYLNYSKSVQQMWEKDLRARIEAADKNWPMLHK